MCYWMPLKGGMQKQGDSNIAAVMGKEAKSTIVAHSMIRFNIGMTKKQAEVITYEHENLLWVRGVLGEDTPDKLRETVLFC